MNIELKCEQCSNIAHQLHHIDGNHKNNAKENLQLLCTLCHAKVHNIEPKKSELKELVILRDRAIRIRNALDNQIRGFSRIEYIVPKYWTTERKQFNSKIKEFEKNIKKLIANGDYSVAKWLLGIKGIGVITAAKLIAYVDIKKTPTVSALWRYCGLDASHIKRTRKISKAEALKFGNPYLKKELMGILADNFVKQRTPIYREIYDKEKEVQLHLMSQKCTENQSARAVIASPPKNRMHAHLRAKRKAVKIFLSHFWQVWRELEGLPVSKPYVSAILNHSKILEVEKNGTN